ETLRIAFGEPLQADTRIRLFDMSGRLLRDAQLAAGQLTILLNVADLPEGIYSVIADNALGSGARKVVVR
ncbi:MAG: T9SS type A sorting domain-containing protein, partial [Thermoanaerobaculia bacterium]|nr:T9SS type A sorting domain-containing protein [Thermoanaerobaculia bacterium]